MSFSYSKLRGKIREVFGTQAAFAEALGCTNITLSQKLNNQSEFTQSEIVKALSVLNVSANEVEDYFFTAKV